MINLDCKEIQVDCYSGYKASTHPVAFSFQEKRFEIQDIVNHWYEGGLYSKRSLLEYFMVKNTNGKNLFFMLSITTREMVVKYDQIHDQISTVFAAHIIIISIKQVICNKTDGWSKICFGNCFCLFAGTA